MSDIAIRINDVVKEFEVYARPLDVALELLTRKSRHQKFQALGGVSFDVERGEVLGIIGPNGAGKSTLLKIITGVLDASAGSVDIAGRVTAILELGLGFNPEYSGRENIFLSGLLYGMDREEVNRKIHGIIAFSGLGDFIERPVKTYSSGMHSRLAFSIATAVDPDILIIDEALAAGDAGFVQKCLRRIRQLCSGGRTVLLVSHGTGLLAQLCNRVVWLDAGRVRMIGPAIQVVQAYDLASHQSADTNSWIETVDDSLDGSAGPAPEPASGGDKLAKTSDADGHKPAVVKFDYRALMASSTDTGRQIFRRGPVFIDNVELLDADNNRSNRLFLCRPATLKVNYRVDGPLPSASLGVAISINNRVDLSPVAQFYSQHIRPTETRESYHDAPERRPPSHRGTLKLHFDQVPFRKGDYLLSIGILPNEPGTWEFYEYRHFYYPFSVDDAGMDVGAPVFLNLAMSHVHRASKADTADVTAPPSLRKPEMVAPVGNAHVSLASGRLRKPSPGSEPTTLREEIEAVCLGKGGYPEQWPRHNECPACGKGELRGAFEKYGFTHERCASCGFVCVNPYPPDEILAKLYDGAYYTRVRELFEAPRLLKGGKATPFSAPEDTLKQVIERAAAGRKSGAWLDVGGGLGAFAGMIAEQLPEWKVRLNEMNQTSIRIARQHARGRFDVVEGDANALSAGGQRFDVISSVAVLEHIPDPISFLEGYVRLLEPGGTLVTIVPHFTELNASVSKGSSANVVPPFHVSLFNENSIRQLMARLPELELISIEQAGPAAYRLIDHIDTGDHWDISIPTPVNPEPRSIKISDYASDESQVLNALGEVDKLAADYFARRDGRMYLIAYHQKLG